MTSNFEDLNLCTIGRDSRGQCDEACCCLIPNIDTALTTGRNTLEILCALVLFMSSQGEDSGPDSEHEEADSIESSDHASQPGAEFSKQQMISKESRFWYLQGELTLDLTDGDWDDDDMPDKGDLAAHFGGMHCHKTAPVSVVHMLIYIDLSRAGRGGYFMTQYKAPIRVYVQAKQTSADKWFTWLQSKGVMEQKAAAIPPSQIMPLCREIDIAEREGWELFVASGRRAAFEVQGNAWKFTGCVVMDVISNDDDDYVGLATKAFQDSTGAPGTLPGGMKYMTVLGDLRSPISGAMGRVKIPIRGYIQCPSKWERWLTWQRTFRFEVVQSGLGSDEDYQTDMQGLQDGSWFEIYTFGKLGLDNAGRREKAVRISASPLRCCF